MMRAISDDCWQSGRCTTSEPPLSRGVARRWPWPEDGEGESSAGGRATPEAAPEVPDPADPPDPPIALELPPATPLEPTVPSPAAQRAARWSCSAVPFGDAGVPAQSVI